MVAVPSRGGRQRGRPPDSDAAATRDRVLRVAREVFNEVGYARTTFKEIARRAGLTRPAVNHYFDGKEALFRTLSASSREAVVEVSREKAETNDVIHDRLVAFLEAAAQVDASDRSYARFMAASLLDAFRYPELREHGQQQIDDLRNLLAGWLSEAQAKGHVSLRADVPALTEMLVAVLWGMSLYAGFVGTHEQLEAVVDQFSELLRRSQW